MSHTYVNAAGQCRGPFLVLLFEGLVDTRLRRLRRKRMGPRFFCCYCRFVSSEEEEEVSGLMEWIARVLTEEEREGEGRGGGGERADGMDGLFLFPPSSLLFSFLRRRQCCFLSSPFSLLHPPLPLFVSHLAAPTGWGIRHWLESECTVQLNAWKYVYIFAWQNMFVEGKHRRDQETHYICSFSHSTCFAKI